MNLKELEAQCMAMSTRIDTEIVEGDPIELSTFANSTLYVWFVPANSGGKDDVGAGRGEPPRMILRGRYGDQLETGQTVAELATKFGITRREAPQFQPSR